MALIITSSALNHLVAPLQAQAQLPKRAYTLEVIRRVPHDTNIFTQGLVLHTDTLYESGGLYGESTIRVYVSQDHSLDRHKALSLPSKYFAEGIAFHQEELLQLTWKAGIAFRYDRDLNPKGTFGYTGEGWGLCDTGKGWASSDGSDIITIRSYADFSPQASLSVRHENKPVYRINALSFRKHPSDQKDYIYANIWGEAYLVEIALPTGEVTATIDASKLYHENPSTKTDPANVLNGIAYYPKNDTFFITGKRWQWLYEVAFREAAQK